MDTRNLNIVAVANRKGGSGKTTTAVNLASEWASRGLRTLLIDLDSQGHAGIGIGFKKIDRGQPSAHNMFVKEDFSIFEAINQTSINNLWLVPANREFDGLGVTNAFPVLKHHLGSDQLKNSFDFIILDTPPSLDIVLINALVAANIVLIPFIPHFLAEEGVIQLSRSYYQIATKYNHSLRLLGLVPIMINKRINMHRNIIRKLTEQFGENKMLSGIRNNIKLAESFEAGEPINLFAPACPGSEDYRRLIEEIEFLM